MTFEFADMPFYSNTYVGLQWHNESVDLQSIEELSAKGESDTYFRIEKESFEVWNIWVGHEEPSDPYSSDIIWEEGDQQKSLTLAKLWCEVYEAQQRYYNEKLEYDIHRI